MNSSIHRFSLDIQSSQSQISIPVMLGDTSRVFRITLSDGGNPYVITNECLAKISIHRPTGSHLEDFCTIEDGTTIVYDFSQNEHTAVVEGIHECEVSLLGLDGEKLTTARFTMLVSDTVERMDDIVLDDEDYASLDAILKAEAARQYAESERATSETARKKAEAGRAEADSKRKSDIDKAIADANAATKNATSIYNDLCSKLANGYFNGTSAYDIAVNNGFKGTEKEWLESLKGNCNAEDGGEETPAPTPTPSEVYRIYYGSVMKDDQITASSITSLTSVNSMKVISTKFAKDKTRFIVAFPTAFASSITVNDDTPLFGGDITSLLTSLDNITVNNLAYKIFAYDVATNVGDMPLTVTLK